LLVLLLPPHSLELRNLRAGPGTRVRFDTQPERGFLATFESRQRTPRKPRGAGGGGAVHLDGQLDGIGVALQLGPGFALPLPQTNTPLWVDVRGPNVELRLAPRAPRAQLDLLGARLPIDDLEVASFGNTRLEPTDLAFDLKGHSRGANIHVGGRLPGALAASGPVPVDVTIDVDHAGGVLGDLMAALVPNVRFGGNRAAGRIRVTGPPNALQID